MGIPAQGGCTCPWGVHAGGGWHRGGVPAWGGVPSQGVYLPRGQAGGVPAQVLPPLNRMTDRCKNITLPQTAFVGGKNIGRIVLSDVC